MTLTTKDLDAIEARAKAATSRPWWKSYTLNTYEIRVDGGPVVAERCTHDDAAHIAGMDPQTTLALVALARIGLRAPQPDAAPEPIGWVARGGTVLYPTKHDAGCAAVLMELSKEDVLALYAAPPAPVPAGEVDLATDIAADFAAAAEDKDSDAWHRTFKRLRTALTAVQPRADAGEVTEAIERFERAVTMRQPSSFRLGNQPQEREYTAAKAALSAALFARRTQP